MTAHDENGHARERVTLTRSQLQMRVMAFLINQHKKPQEYQGIYTSDSGDTKKFSTHKTNYLYSQSFLRDL